MSETNSSKNSNGSSATSPESSKTPVSKPVAKSPVGNSMKGGDQRRTIVEPIAISDDDDDSKEATPGDYKSPYRGRGFGSGWIKWRVMFCFGKLTIGVACLQIAGNRFEISF